MDGAPAGEISERMSRGHQERLGPMVREAMSGSELLFDELDRIAVTVGPGSFTGLRVGIAFAKGLGLATKAPVVGVGTLAALASSHPTSGLKTAVIDAGRGGVWVQSFDGDTSLGPPANTLVAEADLAAAGTLVGPTASRFAVPGQPALDLTAPVLAAIAQLAAIAPLAPPQPMYLRPPDAKPKAR